MNCFFSDLNESHWVRENTFCDFIRRNFNLLLNKRKNLTFRSEQGLAKSKLSAIPSNYPKHNSLCVQTFLTLAPTRCSAALRWSTEQHYRRQTTILSDCQLLESRWTSVITPWKTHLEVVNLGTCQALESISTGTWPLGRMAATSLFSREPKMYKVSYFRRQNHSRSLSSNFIYI